MSQVSQVSRASHHVTTANPATVELFSSPFPAAWVLDGAPQARATAIAHSRDGAMTVIAWSCTKGRFRWQYQVDEMAHILSGEVIITDQSGAERRLGPGDTAFFPAGSSSVWQVIRDVRKIAVCHVAVPKAVGILLRIWSKLCRSGVEMLGLDAEAGASDGGLTNAKRASVAQAQSATPPG
jgi:hypothetical protein